MRYSSILSKTSKTAPADEKTINARLLVQAGFVNKLMAGSYSYLPLGLRVLRKIENIIRQEMNNINGQEVLLPALHPSANWKKTGGWEDIDVLFKLKGRTGREYALGQSHEEVITPLVKEYMNSYKDLPVFVYQIQNKYRDELRAKSGILRGREFGMKDMYSFHIDQDDFDKFYEIAKKAYFNIFSQCGLDVKATEASGGSFSKKVSYEFMVLTNAGEDDIFYCNKCEYCINSEIAKIKQQSQCPKCEKGRLLKARASEVGNVFDLGQKYTKDFNLYVLDADHNKVYPIMGCYGIGTTRLMGVIAEKHFDDKGLVWPKSVAPFIFHIVSINPENKMVKRKTENLYKQLKKQNKEVLYDDRNESAGKKLADADLIGIPYRIIISPETIRKGKIEIKERSKVKPRLIDEKQVFDLN